MDNSPSKKSFDYSGYTCFIIQKYLVIFGCILISLTIGSVYSFGNLLPYFSSYIAYSNRDGTKNLQSIYSEYQYQTNTIYCLLIIFQSVSMSFGTKIYLIFGFQRSCLLGCFIVSFGIGITYFTCNNLFLSCLTFGIMFGIGSGIVYPTLIICAMSWWPNKKKLMAAIISCSYGLGAFIFNLVESYFINPNNIKQDEHFGYMKEDDLMYYFPDIFVLLALIFSLLQIIGILFLRNPSCSMYNKYEYNNNPIQRQHDINNSIVSPYYLGQQHERTYTYNAENNISSYSMYNNNNINFREHDAINDYNHNINNNNIYNDNNCDYTITECLYLFEFWKLFVITMLNIIICMFIIALYQDFSFNYLGINNPLYLSIIGSISSIFHGLFRFGYSSFYDHCISFQKSNGTISVILTCFVGTLSLCKYGGNILIFLWCIVLFSCLGSIYTFIPKCVVKTFGITNCTEISSIIILSEIPASIIFGAISTNLVNSINAYNNILIIMCIFGIISVILTLSFSPQNAIKQRKKYIKKNKKTRNKRKIYEKISRENNENTFNSSQQQQEQQEQEEHDENENKLKRKHERNSITDIIFRYESLIPPYLTVIGGMLIMITIGTTFCFGNIKPYIASYLASKECNKCNHDEMKDLYQKYSDKSNWIFCIAVIFEAIASVIGGKLELYLGAEYCALLGSSILSFGCALTHFTINNIYTIVITYGLLFGFGAGIAYPAVIVCIMRWWPNNIGAATGFIYAGFGFGAFIFDVIETLYVNPTNIRDDPDIGFLDNQDVLNHVPQMFLFIASVFLTMQILGVILLSSNVDITPFFWENNHYKQSKYSKYSEYNRNTSLLSTVQYASLNDKQHRDKSFDSNLSHILLPQQQIEHDDIEYDEYINYLPSQALCTYKFWQLFIISILNMIVFLFITSEWKVFMNDYLNISNDYFASFIGSISSFCNGLFRILWGIYYDWNKSFALSMGTMTICLTIFTGTLSFCIYKPKIMIIWWYGILFSCIGGSYSFYPKVISATFGYTYSGIIIGCLLLAQIPASFSFIFISNSFIHKYSWKDITILMSILSAISAILSITYKTPSYFGINKELNPNQRQTSLYNNSDQFQFIPSSKRTQTNTSSHNAEERAFGDFECEDNFNFDNDINYNQTANIMDNETVCSDNYTHSMISNLSKKSDLTMT